MNENATNLTLKQQNGLIALLSCKTLEDAAKKIDVAPSTIYRWLQDKDFKSEYQNAKTQCTKQTITRLQYISLEAVEVLRTIMNNTKTPASVRVSSAKTIIDTALKGAELEDLAVRVEKLEALLEEKGK